MVTVSRVVPVLSVVEVQLLGGERRAPRAHRPEAQHPAAVYRAEVPHHPTEHVPAARRAVPLDQNLADSGRAVLPGGVQIASGALGVEWDEGVEVRPLADEEQFPVVRGVDASRNSALGQRIAILDEVLVLAVGEPDARPLGYVRRKRQFGDAVGQVVPVDALDDANCRIHVAVIGMHRVDEEVAIRIDVHAGDLGIEGHGHDPSQRDRRRTLLTATGRLGVLRSRGVLLRVYPVCCRIGRIRYLRDPVRGLAGSHCVHQSAAGVLQVEGLAGIVQAQGAELVLGDHSVGPCAQDVWRCELVEADPGSRVEGVYPASDVLESPVLQADIDRAGVV